MSRASIVGSAAGLLACVATAGLATCLAAAAPAPAALALRGDEAGFAGPGFDGPGFDGPGCADGDACAGRGADDGEGHLAPSRSCVRGRTGVGAPGLAPSRGVSLTGPFQLPLSSGDALKSRGPPSTFGR